MRSLRHLKVGTTSAAGALLQKSASVPSTLSSSIPCRHSLNLAECECERTGHWTGRAHRWRPPLAGGRGSMVGHAAACRRRRTRPRPAQQRGLCRHFPPPKALLHVPSGRRKERLHIWEPFIFGSLYWTCVSSTSRGSLYSEASRNTRRRRLGTPKPVEPHPKIFLHMNPQTCAGAPLQDMAPAQHGIAAGQC